MSNGILIAPLTPAAVAASTGTGGANLITPDPKEVWASTAAGAASNLDFDFGANVSIDSVFVGFIDGGAPTLAWTSGTAAYTTVTNQASVSAYAPPAGTNPYRRHGFWRLAAPVVHRFHRIAFNPVTVATARIGIIIFGLALQTTYNREWGSGRQVIDTGAKQRLLGGGFGIGEGARKAAYKWTWGDLSDAEVAAIYDLVLGLGETKAMLAVEAPDQVAGLNEGLHYGLFDKFETYERANPQLTRWSLSVEQWV
jgi:hypothetical protein